MSTTGLPNIANVTLLGPDGLPNPQFIRMWQDQLAAQQQTNLTLQNQITSQQSTLAALQANQAAAAAAQAQANTALNVADSGGSAGAQSGTTSQAGPNIGTAWTPGPRVDLTSVIAGNLGATVAFSGSQTSPIALSDTGNYRVQQIIGGVETTVFTGALQVASYPNYTPSGQSGWIVVVYDTSTNVWSGVNFPEASTGSVSYRLDFELSTLTYFLSSSSLYVRRA